MARARLQLAIVTAAFVAMAGCYSARPYGYEGHDLNATVIVYRQASLNLAGLSAYVALDGRVIAALHQDSFVEIRLPPGRHEIRLNATQFPRGDTVTVDVRDLDWLYYEAEPNPANLAAAAAGAVDPTIIGAYIGSLFIKPFLLDPSSHDEFRAVVEDLKRVEPKD